MNAHLCNLLIRFFFLYHAIKCQSEFCEVFCFRDQHQIRYEKKRLAHTYIDRFKVSPSILCNSTLNNRNKIAIFVVPHERAHVKMCIHFGIAMKIAILFFCQIGYDLNIYRSITTGLKWNPLKIGNSTLRKLYSFRQFHLKLEHVR